MLVWVLEDRVILKLVENGHEKNIEVRISLNIIIWNLGKDRTLGGSL
ncbi:MAG: hypothetical protein A4E55_00304 [Pelotomaculum sp. PtaU1.Bin035]|nr:MAG: hypothetical protein A4E55_00304 [Pelotomaculum sp. PtaU1.Bin035]